MSGGAVINGVGAISALGPDLSSLTAAYHAGAAAFIRDPTLIGPDGLPVTHAPVYGIADLRNHEVRLCRLFQAATDDLMAQTGAAGVGLPLLLILPGWLRRDGIEDHLVRLFQTEGGGDRYRSIVIGWADRATVMTALAQADALIGQGKHAAVAVGVIDTFMHAELIDILSLDGRLMTQGQPHGLIPSEAAVIFRLTSDRGQVMGAPTGVLAGIWTGTEPQPVRQPDTILGRPLADLLAQAARVQRPDRLMLDLNGERWRAEEVGTAVVSSPTLGDPVRAEFEVPLTLTGDCGAASSALMVALALSPAPGDGPAVVPGARLEWTMITLCDVTGRRAVATIGRAVDPARTRGAPAEDSSADEAKGRT